MDVMGAYYGNLVGAYYQVTFHAWNFKEWIKCKLKQKIHEKRHFILNWI